MAIKKLHQPIYYGHLGEPLSDFLDEDELTGFRTLSQSLGLDVTTGGHFYECIVARIVDGATTSHTAPHDVEVPVNEGIVTIEVKGGKAWYAKFLNKGRDFSRDVFRFDIRRNPTKSDFMVVMGLRKETLYSWVIPRDAIKGRSSHITICAPWSRLTTVKNAPYAGYACPPSQILDAIICWRGYGFDNLSEDLEEKLQKEVKIVRAATAVRNYWKRKERNSKTLPLFE